jgi:CHAD domain-containing protein
MMSAGLPSAEDMNPGGKKNEPLSARALDKAVRRNWREWHAVTVKARRDPGSRRLVHRFRIATRRLLAAEDLLGTAPPGSPIRDRLDAAFRAAGRIRDLQICRSELATFDDRYEAARTVARAARKRLPALVQRLRHELRAVKSGDVRAAVRRLRARLRPAEESAPARRARARVLASSLLRRREALRQLERFARGLGPDTDDAALHSLRLRLKGVRYMSELLGSLDADSRRMMQPFDAWQRALGGITDQRAVLREMDRCRIHRDAPEEALALLRQHVLRTERRLIRALFEPAARARPGAAQLRLLRTAPLIR